ncbi:MAG: thiamine pyrophosphate-dependent enzyme [Candidatus Thorarchaeota archaeon]
MKEDTSDRLLSGNEAIARGALEAGVGFCASYPGTPSTEITQTLMNNAREVKGLYVEWSTNEKVALEAATAASWAGVPALCPMKSLGLNVASDFLLNVNLSGTGPGGLVIVVCDDPRGHSSSNEQDSRFYAKAAQVPLLEPSSQQQAKDLVPFAFDVSRRYDTPVIIRSTTRLSHSRARVTLGDIPKKGTVADHPVSGRFNVPNPHLRHRDVLDRLERIEKEFADSTLNALTVEKDSDLLVIATGISWQYAREAAASVEGKRPSLLNLVTTYPVPRPIMRRALEDFGRVLFVEENDPFVEDETRIMSTLWEMPSTQLLGKRTAHIPYVGEMSTDLVRNALCRVLGIPQEHQMSEAREAARTLLVNRPLAFCAGCTHRNFYYALRRVRKRLGGDLVVAGDIGCYSLGVFYDETTNTMQAMGSGIGVANGLGQLGDLGFTKRVVAVIGDSTLFHGGLPGLINARHKNANLTLVILDNQTTAMTGFQVHPGSKRQTDSLTRISIQKMVEALEPDLFVRGDASDLSGTTDLLYDTVRKDGLKVILLDSVCRLEEARYQDELPGAEVVIDDSLCVGEKCAICTRDFGCPAIVWMKETGRPVIDQDLCVRCGACIDVCPHGAIREAD